MCTVTFLPRADKFYITSNRDESPGRQSHGLTHIHSPGNPMIYFPLDPQSGGSWIAMADNGRAVCLLNGAFEPFKPEPAYLMSRGTVILQAAGATDPNAFLSNFPLEGVAPFTLLMFENNLFEQLIWDGEQRHQSSIPADQPQIWSSVTLYPPEVRKWRKSLFEKWLNETKAYTQESILAFHQQANGDGINDFIMNRNNIVRTLSITSIGLGVESASMLHLRLEPPGREEIIVRYEQ